MPGGPLSPAAVSFRPRNSTAKPSDHLLPQPNDQRKAAAQVTAKYISVRNAEALVGQGYRWCRDMAHALGVPVIKAGKKRLIPAAEFFAALESASANDTAAAPAAEEDPTATVFRALGWEVRK